MKASAELDFLDCAGLLLLCWLVLPLTCLGAAIAGGQVTVFFRLVPAASALLVAGLGRWRAWPLRLLRVLSTASTRALTTGAVWSYFRNFC